MSHSFFVVWTLGHQPLYEEVKLDRAFMTKVINNLTLFYKAYFVPCILGYRDIFQCPKCEKVILEEEEIDCTATQNSICCDACNTWRHLPCAGLTEGCVESLDTWLYFSCLIDNAGTCDDDNTSPWGDGNTGEEVSKCYPGASSSQGISHAGEMNNICSVYYIQDIPVG